MKKILLVLAIVLISLLIYWRYISSHNPSPQTATSCQFVEKQKFDNLAGVIEKNIASYSSTSEDIIGKSTEGGQQINYFSEDKRVLVKQTFFGETGKSDADFYFGDEGIFLIKKSNTEYEKPLYEDPSGKPKSVVEKEFYMGKEQRLCLWYQDGQIQENNGDTADLVNFLMSGVNK